MSHRVLFFSRGRGHGHAVPDMAIAHELLNLAPETTVQFASYATGTATLRQGGWEVFDLHLPENNPFLPTLLVCADVIRRVSPSVIVAHEEFAALVAGRMAGTPSIFLSAWLPLAQGYAHDAMACADSAIILEEPGIFATPGNMGVQPRFVGRLRREISHTPADRARARGALAVPEDAVVVTVIPGGFASEEKAPFFPLVADAFQRLPFPEKRLFWLGGADAKKLASSTQDLPSITILDHQPSIDHFLVASDVVITKGTRGATLDAVAAGVPSISLSPGLNPIDDLLVPRIRSNLALNARAVTGEILAWHIARALRRSATAAPATEEDEGPTAAQVAGELWRQMQLFQDAGQRARADAISRRKD